MRASAGSRGGAGVREEAVTGTLDEETARAAGLELTEPDPLVASGARLRIAATGIGAGAGKSAVCVTTTGAEAGDGAVAGLPARAAGRITTEAPRPVGTMFTAAASARASTGVGASCRGTVCTAASGTAGVVETSAIAARRPGTASRTPAGTVGAAMIAFSGVSAMSGALAARWASATNDPLVPPKTRFAGAAGSGTGICPVSGANAGRTASRDAMRRANVTALAGMPGVADALAANAGGSAARGFKAEGAMTTSTSGVKP
ncbi:MAG: hypothetical protein HLUCCX21_00075 [Porphyrobacter sp. HL-46]|nr:MAG: hypothetical protein HLUCCX21_00075 [Porphyrobacter sp. HL-46]